LALEMYLSGDSLGAIEPALRAENLGREQVKLLAHTATEEEALRYAGARPSCLDLLLTLAVIDADAPIAASVWGAALESRGLVLDELASRHRAILFSRDRQLAIAQDSLGRARGELARRTLSGPDSTSDDYASVLDSTRVECRRLERRLAGLSSIYRSEFDRERIGFDEV